MTDLDSIYREYHGKVLAYFRGKVNNPTVSEDLCAEVFLKVTASIDRYDGSKSAISTWIYNIARNTLIDYFRTRREPYELDESLAADDDFVEKLCNESMLDTLADALESLPLRERELIIRHYYRGETLRELSRSFDLSYSYINMLHKSALQKMKKFF